MQQPHRKPAPVATSIHYEQPLNERIRTFLRLEFLFQQTARYLAGSSQWDSRNTLHSLLEIIHIFGRADLKTEAMKELDRHIQNLARLEQNPNVDRSLLVGILDELDRLIDQLHSINGQITSTLKKNEFLSAIMQRSAIPGGTCDFDLPEYHFWLQQAPERRTRDLSGWLHHFDSIAEAIQLILRLTRDSAVMRTEEATAGFFQKNLDPKLPCQLVRVAVPAGAPYFAEISGGKHRFTVRFLEVPVIGERPVQTSQDVSFSLGCCII
jgi:cell division protein ZapD